MNDTETTQPGSSAPANEGPLGTVKGLIDEHPVAMLAGGILLGALIAGALSPRSEGKPRRSFGRRAVQIATLGAELAAAYVAGADSLASDAPEPAPQSPLSAPETAKSQTRRMSTLAATALRTLGPVLSRRMGRKTPG